MFTIDDIYVIGMFLVFVSIQLYFLQGKLFYQWM